MLEAGNSFYTLLCDISSALSVLFNGILSNTGHMFSPKLWELIFRGVLIPIFSNVGYSHREAVVCPAVFRFLLFGVS